MVIQACDQLGLNLRDGKLCLWSNYPGEGIRIGTKTLTP